MSLQLDHIAFGAANLADGIEYMSKLLGVPPIGGGKHRLFGTHNALWRIEGDNYPIYLEVIAIDHKAKPLQQPRWFGLDNKNIQKQLSKQCQLLTFIVSCDDIGSMQEKMEKTHATPISLNRGDLAWKFSLPKNGDLVANGALPYLIEWQNKSPTETMKTQGIKINSIAGSQIKNLDVNWPCSHRLSNKSLEVILLNKNGEEIIFCKK